MRASHILIFLGVLVIIFAASKLPEIVRYFQHSPRDASKEGEEQEGEPWTTNGPVPRVVSTDAFAHPIVPIPKDEGEQPLEDSASSQDEDS